MSPTAFAIIAVIVVITFVAGFIGGRAWEQRNTSFYDDEGL